jgi:shikimate dehydrogenase
MIQIAGSTQLLGVIGCPIEHSLSPALHNAALFSRGMALGHTALEYVYLPLKVEPDHLEAALLGMAALNWRGFNVTIPHKQSVMQYLQQVSPLAQAVGAVNTVWRQEEVWFGTNTDVQGFLAPLLAYNRDWKASEACILGSGGAARAVIAACAQLGCKSIHAVGRNRSKLANLQQSLSDTELNIAIQVHEWQALDELLPRMGLLVNTTPVGMHPQVQASPLNSAAIALLPSDAIVYDLIYTPRPTQFLTFAQQQGYRVLDGLEMLIHQGAAAFEIWVGEAPSIEAMQQAAIAGLKSKR